MSRFSPGFQYRPAQSLDFAPLNDAISGARANGVRDRQLAIQEQEQADRHAQQTAEQAQRRAELETWSHAAPLSDIADASKVLSGPYANTGPDAVQSPPFSQRGASSIAEALDPSVAGPKLSVGNPAPPSSPLLSRVTAGLGIAPRPAAPVAPAGGGALGLNATREQAVPAPGDDPSDPQALKRALSAILPSYTAADEDGNLRVYDPAQRVVNQAAPQMIAQRLNEEYATRKANETLDRKAAPFLGMTNPQTGQPFTREEARAVADNPQFASAIFRESHDDDLTPHPVMVNGKPVMALANKKGQFFDANHQPLTGDVRPYQPPQHDQFVFPVGADETTGKPVVLRGNTHTGALESTGQAARQTTANGGKLSQDEAYTSQHLGVLASTVKDIADKTAPSAWQKLASRNMLGNYTLTPEGQQYNANVDRAALSLAVIMEGPRGATPQRVDMVKNSYFPKPGDDPSTVADKVAKLKVAMTGAKQKAGRGYEQMDPALKSTVDTFLGGSGGAAPAGGKPALATRVQELKAQGLSKDAARATLAKEGYSLSGAP
jgi:hypothetical protein